MSIIVILWILFTHWVADFVFQTHEMSINKSKSNWWLSYHVLAYTAISGTMWLPFIVASNNPLMYYFSMLSITFITHWITDYNTSRWTSKLWAKGDVHNFFVVIGIDQFIHYLTLVVTYKILLWQ